MNANDKAAAVVTGVSTGIGRAIAEALIADGWRVFGSVRKETDARAACDALGADFEPLQFDVTDAGAIAAAAEKVRAQLGCRPLGALVNNAGVAVAGPLRYIPLADIERQIDVNVYGAIRATQAFLPLLLGDGAAAPGRVINMSSVAGRLASPFMGPYSMSKHAIEAFSDSLRREMIPHGLDVIVVGPGAIRTPIWEKADDIDIEQYAETEYAETMKQMKAEMQAFGDTGLPPGDVGELVVKILNARKPRARYAILKKKVMMWTLPNILPKRVVDNALAKRFGLKRKES